MPPLATGESPDPETTAQATGSDPVNQDATTADSSVAGQDPSPASGASPSDANPAESSAAENPDAKKPDLASVIRDAVAPKETAEGESSTPKTGKSETTAADDGQKQTDADAGKDADADIPAEFHKHPAWQRLKGARDEARSRVSELEQPAEQFGKVVDFMQKNGLSAEDVANTLTVAALIRNDPQEALKALRPIVGNLEKALGEVLPDDLKADVEAGTISEARALELSRARSQTALTERRAQTVTESAEAEREANAAKTVRDAMTAAVTTWETGIKSSDPDYATKAPWVHDRIRAIVSSTGKVPRTADDAIALAKQAYADVNERLKPLRPAPKPHTPTPTGASPASVKAQPKTLREAIELGARMPA